MFCTLLFFFFSELKCNETESVLNLRIMSFRHEKKKDLKWTIFKFFLRTKKNKIKNKKLFKENFLRKHCIQNKFCYQFKIKKYSFRHSRKRRLISCLICKFYIIRIIEVYNFRANKWIRLIKDLIQDISKIVPLFELHLIVFNISEISRFMSFFLHWP